MNTYQRQREFERKSHDNFNRYLSQIKFRDEDGNLRRKLLTDEASEIAKEFKRSNLTNSQLRKFYNEVKALKDRIEATEGNDEEKFKKNEAMIAMLKSKITYARYRPQGKNLEALKKFIDTFIDKIRSFQDFEDFIIFFEAVVGFANLRG